MKTEKQLTNTNIENYKTIKN